MILTIATFFIITLFYIKKGEKPKNGKQGRNFFKKS